MNAYENIITLLDPEALMSEILKNGNVEELCANEYNNLLNGPYSTNHIEVAHGDCRCVIVKKDDRKLGLPHFSIYRKKK